MIIFLDTGVLGFVTHSKASGTALACNKWLESRLTAGDTVCIPEICDYELRRELVRIKSADSISRLDALESAVEYIPLDTAAIRRAAEYWATVRNEHRPTAGELDLDADMILAAQVNLFPAAEQVLVATTNVKHLIRFVNAREWQDI